MASGLFKRVVARLAQPNCPACGSAISPEDIDLEQQAVLCRACGQRSAIPSAGGQGPDPIAELMQRWTPSDPPIEPPARARTAFEACGAELVLTRSTRQLAVAIFLAIWVSGWTVGCVFLVRQAIVGASVALSLFSIPFLLGWAAGFLTLLWSLLGEERFVVAPDGIRRESHIVVCVRRRMMPLNDVRGIERFVVTSSESSSSSFGLRVRGHERTIDFGQGLPDEELLWLADLVRGWIHGLDPRLLPVSEASQAEGQRAHALAIRVEVLQPGSALVAPPASTPIRLEREGDCTRIIRTGFGKSSVGAMIFLTLFGLFWNGISWTMFVQAVRDGQLFVALFLTPFVLIGLAVAVLWLLAAGSPAVRRTWTFGAGFVERRWSIFGVGRGTEQPLSRLNRVELRRMPKGTGQFVRMQGQAGTPEVCSLAFVGSDREDVAMIPSLSEDEARWLASELFDDFRRWFVRVGA